MINKLNSKGESLLWGVLIFLVFVFLSFLLLPNFTIFRSDDFGYYESLLISLQSGGILRSEWLEPLNISLTAISSFLYYVSGNFYWSSLGLILALSILNFILIIYILKSYFKINTSVFIAFLFCTFPVYVNKSTEFTGTLLSISLFLISLVLYQKKRVKLFYVIVLIAFANRQNAVILLGLPFFDFLKSWVQEKKVRFDLGIFTLIFFALAFILLKSQNVTYAQYHITNHLISNLNLWVSLNTLLRTMTMLVISLGLIQLFFLRFSLNQLKHNFKKFKIPIIISLLGILTYLLNYDRLFTFNGPGLDTLTQKFGLTHLLFVLSILFPWFLDYRFIKRELMNNPLIFVIIFQVILLSLKGVLWDYYFIEIQILLLLVFFNYYSHEIRIKKLLLIGVLVFNLSYLYLFKVYTDSIELKTLVYEKLLRQKRIELAELTNAPWAYSGWKLYNYYITNDGKDNFTALSKYLCYLNNPSVATKIEYPSLGFVSNMINKGYNASYIEVLESGQYRIGGIMCNFQVLRKRHSELINPCSKENLDFDLNDKILNRIAPLNNKEWELLINY